MKNSGKFHSIKAVGFDLDGVIYIGKSVVPGARYIIDYLRKKGIYVFFISNNSTKTREEIADKLLSMNIKISPEEMMTSAYATAAYFSENKKLRNKRIFAIGSEGLKKELKKQKLKLTENAFQCDYLVVGMDFNFNYYKIQLAINALRKGARFIACNIDRMFPLSKRIMSPACGAMIGAIEASSGRKPDLVIGKPTPLMLEIVARRKGLQPEEILIVGDGIKEDIVMAKRFGAYSVLFMPGKKNRIETENQPDLILSGLSMLTKYV